MDDKKEHLGEMQVILERVQELYNAIMGPKLMKKVGIMHRLETTEENVNFLTQKFVEVEDKIEAVKNTIINELNLIKIENAKSITKINTLWAIIGTVAGIGLTLIMEYVFKK